ncbi:hypothetical protein [Rhizobium laguerreae]|uniref:TniQ protein n=1 Tax=Rhizobium laguerreae TaxID=1076926 RepID=A0AAX2QS43_9HYPH|nr:hypothetical protein [Rhizobium laguerreae]TCU29521.1 hypothetical protein EV131_1012 [Rhizobium laguerreae]
MNDACPTPLSADYARRLLSLIGIRAAVPIIPILGEGIADLLFRSASINGFSNVGRLLGWKYSRRFSHFSFAASWHDDLAGVGDILGTPNGDADLRKLFYPSSAGHGDNSRSVDFFGASIPPKQLIAHRRVAPTSLVSSAHSKAVWHLNALSFDVHSGEMLLEACPRCQEKLTFNYTAGVCFCHLCDFDFREAPQPLVDVSDRDALRFVTGLIDPERREGKLAVRLLHPDLNRENPGYIFFLCVLIALVFDGNGLGGTGKRRDLGRSKVSPESLAKAGRSVLNWPSGIFDAMTMLEVRSGFSLNASASRGRFYRLCFSSRNLSPSLLKSIRGASTFIHDGCAVEVTDHAAAVEQIGQRAFLVVRRSSAFRAVCREKALPPLVLYNCMLHNQKHNTIAETGRANLLPERIPWFDINRIAFHKGRALSVTLQRFVKLSYSGAGDPWPEVFLGMRSGELPVVKKNVDTGSWRDSLLVVDFEEGTRFMKRVRGMTVTADFPLKWDDASFYIGCSYKHARDRLLKVFHDETITLRKLQGFSREFITLREAADLSIVLGIREDRRTILKRAKMLNLTRHPEADVYWCRGEIENLYRGTG